MCGIAGIVSFTESESSHAEVVHRMCDSMAHRGPDDEGIALLDHCVLGMRRLSIIDLSTGRQPLFNEDRSVVVVGNGEVYNYKDLRGDLIARGHRLESQSDMAVVPHLYEERGEDFVDEICGMYAIAVWDAHRRRLTIVRDRLGQKPIYYAIRDDYFLFASELKALVHSEFIHVEPDWEALRAYMSLGRVPGRMCALKGVYKLQPGHFLTHDVSATQTRRYWLPSFAEKWRADESDYAEAVESTLRAAIDLRLQSDVPLGAFLSGGVDSSLVVGMAQQRASKPIKTFCVSFSDDDFSEARYARLAARHLGTDHHEMQVRISDPEILPKLVYHLDEPFSDDSYIPVYAVSELAGRDVTVVLTGDAGDEVFGGYDWYPAMRLGMTYTKAPRAVRRLIAAVAKSIRAPQRRSGLSLVVARSRMVLQKLALDYSSEADMFAALLEIDRDVSLETLLTPEARKVFRDARPLRCQRETFAMYDGDDAVEAAMFGQMMTMLPDMFFMKVDRMSMAASLEARSPFADHRLVELAARIPFDQHVRGLATKRLLKRIALKYAPKEVICRRKQGFGTPMARWIRNGRLREFVTDVLTSESFRSRGVYELRHLDALLRSHMNGTADHYRRIFNILCLELWFRAYIDR